MRSYVCGRTRHVRASPFHRCHRKDYLIPRFDPPLHGFHRADCGQGSTSSPEQSSKCHHTSTSGVYRYFGVIYSLQRKEYLERKKKNSKVRMIEGKAKDNLKKEGEIVEKMIQEVGVDQASCGL